MAQVTGKTSEKIDELLDETVVSGGMDADGQMSLVTRGGTVLSAGSVANNVVSAAIDGTGHLILTRRDGTTVDAGIVGGAPYKSWPVGSIFLSVSPTNPATLLGGGTWTRWGKGRVPVGVDEADAAFDTAEETAGSKTHTLTTAEMPNHAHGGSTTFNGDHSHGVWKGTGASGSSDGFTIDTSTTQSSWGGMIQNSGNHQHGIPSEGGGQPHNNLQPYITCYMWKRTA